MADRSFSPYGMHSPENDPRPVYYINHGIESTEQGEYIPIIPQYPYPQHQRINTRGKTIPHRYSHRYSPKEQAMQTIQPATHPLKYKTKICIPWNKGNQCIYNKNFCYFAHGYEDVIHHLSDKEYHSLKIDNKLYRERRNKILSLRDRIHSLEDEINDLKLQLLEKNHQEKKYQKKSVVENSATIPV